MSAWEKFATELRNHMDRPRSGKVITAPALASMVGVEADTVRNWRKGRVKPQIDLLPTIARALRMGADASLGTEWDALYLPRVMGLLGDSAADADAALLKVLAVQKLEARVTKAQEAGTRVGMSVGASLLVQRASELGTWAVGVWPAVEGVDDCQLYVADRITFLRTDGEPVTAEALDADFQGLLDTCQAMPSAPSVRPRWMSFDDRVGSYWSIPRVGATRASDREPTWGNLRCVGMVALTTQSWVNDLASHLADVLGYGQRSTRHIATDVTGERLGDSTRSWRRKAHEQLLVDRPAKRVWSHFDHTGPLHDGQPVGPGLKLVYVRESDIVLQSSSLVPKTASLEQLLAERNRTDEIAAAAADVLTVHMNPQPSNIRSQRWEQVLLGLRDTLEWLCSTTDLDAREVVAEVVKRNGRNESARRAQSIVRWLSNHGWPS